MDYNRILILFRKKVMDMVGYKQDMGVREGLILAMEALAEIEECATRGIYMLPWDIQEGQDGTDT